MSIPPKGPKRVVRKRPLTTSFKPRPSAEIDDQSYFKKRPRSDRDEAPRRDYQDDRPRGPRSPRDAGGPPRGKGGFGGPPRGKGGFGDRKYGDKPAGRPPYRDRDDRRPSDRPYRDRDDRRPADRIPYRDERKPNDNRILLDTVKRLESGMTEILERLARIEKELAAKAE